MKFQDPEIVIGCCGQIKYKIGNVIQLMRARDWHIMVVVVVVGGGACMGAVGYEADLR